jgi:RNA polymerase sigma-70 factor (ECF subfamily)
MPEGKLETRHGVLSPTDEELETRWKQGSAPAFAVLFERWHGRVYGLVLRITGDRHLAEDVAQRAFMNLYASPPPGGGRSSFKALLFTIARNEAIDELRKRGRRRETSMEATPERSGGAASPAELADRDEVQARVRAALAHLPAETREVVLLREGEGLTIVEVCEVTGLTRDAVRWRLARGLEALQAALGARAPAAEGEPGPGRAGGGERVT